MDLGRQKRTRKPFTSQFKKIKQTPQQEHERALLRDPVVDLMQDRKFPARNGRTMTLTPEVALVAFNRARRFEISSPSIRRKESATQNRYSKNLNTLRESSDDGINDRCPFAGFMNYEFTRSSTFYGFKAALQSYAVDLLEKAGPGMLCALAANKNIDAVGNRISHIFNVDKNGGSPLPPPSKNTNVDKTQAAYARYTNVDNLSIKDSITCFSELSDQVVKAAAFLWFYPPLAEEKTAHLHDVVGRKDTEDSTLKLRYKQHRKYQGAFQAPGFFLYEPEFAAAFHEVSTKRAAGIEISDDNEDLKVVQKKRYQGKGYREEDFIFFDENKKPDTKGLVVSELKRLDAKLGDGIEWRQRFFNSLEELSPNNQQKREDRQKQIAVLSLSGCRPKELVMGVRVHVEPSKPNSKSVAMVFRVPGAKFTNRGDETEISIYETLNADEKIYQRELYNNEKYQTSLEKGHEWRYIRVESESAEALWLRDYVTRNADGQADDPQNMDNMGFAEQLAFDDILENDPIASLTIQPDYVSKHKINVNNEADNLRVVDSISAWTRYHARTHVFPTIEGFVTAYCWRHQFSSDVKLYAKSYEERAKALGQVSERTQSRYGHKRSGRNSARGGKFSKITLSASRGVRNNFRNASNIDHTSPRP
ncbi:hypothetical protein ACGYLI_16720 [Sulfitobacter sp. 1A13421]|uniref:hypothetical protein n=1 Tax=Sulfitobacter sp. 1A13421 TaxID=3368595 RepID=UPI003746E99F